MRNLGEPEGEITLPNDTDKCESVAVMKAQVKTLLVEALMKFAQGSGKKKVCPFGAKAARSKEHFKKVMSSAFATTLAVAYPFIAEDKSTWKQKCKTAIHPMTSLWPKAVVKRFIHFGTVVRSHRANLFKAYETGGGKYSTIQQDEDDESDTPDEEDDEETEEDEGCDNVF